MEKKLKQWDGEERRRYPSEWDGPERRHCPVSGECPFVEKIDQKAACAMRKVSDLERDKASNRFIYWIIGIIIAYMTVVTGGLFAFQSKNFEKLNEKLGEVRTAVAVNNSRVLNMQEKIKDLEANIKEHALNQKRTYR